MVVVYGLDLEKEITPILVRDAITRCFIEAHRDDSGIEDGESEEYCIEIVKKAFKETGGDFNYPSKESLVEVIKNLANFSKSFRNQELISKHYNQILEVINKLE